MASCTKVTGHLQAYVDDELSQADRLVLEQHVSECAACRAELQGHQRVSALMYDTFSEDRLGESLRQRVLESLPEPHRNVEQDIAGLNWRAKHPRNRMMTLLHRAPLAVAGILMVLAIVIRSYWPQDALPGPSSIGVVTQAGGAAFVADESGVMQEQAEVERFVDPATRLETGPDATMMVSMLGPTDVKMNANTRVQIRDARRVVVEEGETWFNVGRDGTRFVVETPAGRVRVLGTSFAVRVTGDETTVTVVSGEVHLEASGRRGGFVLLRDDQQAAVRRGGSPTPPEKVESDAETRWARAIAPDPKAQRTFATTLLERQDVLELPAKPVQFVRTRQGGQQYAVSAVRLYWDAEAVMPGALASYDVYVYDQNMRPLFRERVEAATLAEPDREFVELPCPEGPLTGTDLLFIRLVPDFSTGTMETTFKVMARGA